jgi:dTDP-glucose 4,6-dehydratase
VSKRYLILGGGCSFAVHLSRYLLNAGAERVTAVGRSPSKSRCFTLGVGEGDPRYSYHAVDVVRDIDRLSELFERDRPEIIVNFAAEGESSASFKESWRYFDTNCVGMARLIERVMLCQYISRFVHVSSGEVYGSTDHPLKEDEALRPSSPYAASKAAFDAHLQAVARKLTLRMNIVRPANTYGEGQQLHRFIPKAFLFGMTGRRMPLYGSGTGLKSYLHSEDLARAIYLLGNHAPLSRIYNLGPAMPTSMRDIAYMIAERLGIPQSTLCEDVGLRRGTDARYWFDSSAAERDFGWRPEISLDRGLGRVQGWVAGNLAELSGLPTEYQRLAA